MKHKKEVLNKAIKIEKETKIPKISNHKNKLVFNGGNKNLPVFLKLIQCVISPGAKVSNVRK